MSIDTSTDVLRNIIYGNKWNIRSNCGSGSIGRPPEHKEGPKQGLLLPSGSEWEDTNLLIGAQQSGIDICGDGILPHKLTFRGFEIMRNRNGVRFRNGASATLQNSRVYNNR